MIFAYLEKKPLAYSQVLVIEVLLLVGLNLMAGIVYAALGLLRFESPPGIFCQ